MILISALLFAQATAPIPTANGATTTPPTKHAISELTREILERTAATVAAARADAAAAKAKYDLAQQRADIITESQNRDHNSAIVSECKKIGATEDQIQAGECRVDLSWSSPENKTGRPDGAVWIEPKAKP